MAANHNAARESFRLQYAQEYLRRRNLQRPDLETVWIIQRYDPKDERTIAPVPRHKLIALKQEPLVVSDAHWVPKSETSLTVFKERTFADSGIFHLSHPATRCQEWSTLRQMLPTYSCISRVEQQNWGVSHSGTEAFVVRMPEKLPHVNSAFTKYVDTMCQAHRGFKLY